MRQSVYAGILGLSLWACGEPVEPIPSDAGSDGGLDSGPSDSGPSDSGPFDSGRPDSGIDDPGPFTWPLPTGPIPITPHASWKNRLSVPDDPFFFSTDYAADGIRWVKFSVLVRDPTKVYFQDGHTYRFHPDFAIARLDPFSGMTPADIERISQHEAGQEVIFGAVLIPLNANVHEYAIQLVREDVYHPEMVRVVHDLVIGAIDAASGERAFYFPTYEQAAEAAHWKDWLLDRNVRVDAPTRWLTHDYCYTAGWALGRLTYVPGDALRAATRQGRLLPTDVLLTDGAPTSLPQVAGVLSLTPSTSSADVAILARTYGVPFAYLVAPEDQARARSLDGRDVMLESIPSFYGCSVRLVDLEAQISAGDRAAVLALKDTPALVVRPKASVGAISGNVDGLVDADVAHYGGKVVGYALLRETIPEHTPPAFALSFDLWDRFLDQTLSNGATLRSEITTRIFGESDRDPGMLDADLTALRAIIEDQASFDASTRQQIGAALLGLGADQRLRLRASTNVEDDASYVGAGVHDTEARCVANELDGCLAAIRRLYASFFSFDAVIERQRLSVAEVEVAMGILVTVEPASADVVANGAGTFAVRGDSAEANLVTQRGTVSPSQLAWSTVPEVANAYVGQLGIYFDILSRSSLVPLGDEVMTFADDYDAFAGLFQTVARRYETRHAGVDNYTLDFAYLKDASGGLVVDQVRRLPVPSYEATVPVYFAAAPRTLCTFQGEAGDVFANHRLKVRFTLTPRGSWLADPDLASSLYADGALVYVDGSTTATIRGAPGSWPAAAYERQGDATIDRFDASSDHGLLRTTLTRLERPTQSAVKLVGDFWANYEVVHTTPVPVLDWMGVATRTEDNVSLVGCPEDNRVGPNNQRHAETITVAGITIETAYWWPEAPRGPTAGYTAPLYRWDQTTITGLTTAPIVLKSYWSQTYRPQHHNFGSDYIFDPWLEPGIAESVKDELRAANVRFLYVAGENLWALGLDDVLRQL